MTETYFVEDQTLINEVLNMSKLVPIDQEYVNKVRQGLLTMIKWCSTATNSLKMKMCTKYFELLKEIFHKLQTLRTRKALEGANIEQSYDEIMMKTLFQIKDSFVRLLLYSFRTDDMFVLCKVLKPFALRNMVYTPGALVMIPLHEAVLLFALGFVKPYLFDELLNL